MTYHTMTLAGPNVTVRCSFVGYHFSVRRADLPTTIRCLSCMDNVEVKAIGGYEMIIVPAGDTALAQFGGESWTEVYNRYSQELISARSIGRLCPLYFSAEEGGDYVDSYDPDFDAADRAEYELDRAEDAYAELMWGKW